MMALSTLRVFETLFYQSHLGTGENKLLVSEQRSMEFMFSLESFREWWSENPFSFDAEFRGWVESFFPANADQED